MEVCRLEVPLQYMKRDINKLILLLLLVSLLFNAALFSTINQILEIFLSQRQRQHFMTFRKILIFGILPKLPKILPCERFSEFDCV